jgi:hypothetical protein
MTMVNQSMPGQQAVAARAGRAGAAFAEKLGSLFSQTLQRLYEAHTEKVQMRFAPQPIHSGRLPKRRSFIGL